MSSLWPNAPSLAKRIASFVEDSKTKNGGELRDLYFTKGTDRVAAGTDRAAASTIRAAAAAPDSEYTSDITDWKVFSEL